MCPTKNLLRQSLRWSPAREGWSPLMPAVAPRHENPPRRRPVFGLVPASSWVGAHASLRPRQLADQFSGWCPSVSLGCCSCSGWCPPVPKQRRETNGKEEIRLARKKAHFGRKKSTSAEKDRAADKTSGTQFGKTKTHFGRRNRCMATRERCTAHKYPLQPRRIPLAPSAKTVCNRNCLPGSMGVQPPVKPRLARLQPLVKPRY